VTGHFGHEVSILERRVAHAPVVGVKDGSLVIRWTDEIVESSGDWSLWCEDCCREIDPAEIGKTPEGWIVDSGEV
jgi:hypothetical protein